MNEWPKHESEDSNFESQVAKLPILLKQLEEIGFKTRPLEEIMQALREGVTTPIVFDGADGIRVRYNESRGLVLGFTNGFENPNDARVVEVKELWNSISN